MDYSDLSDRLDWALAHDAEASAIAARGAQLVSMLLASTRCKWHACEVCAESALGGQLAVNHLQS